MAITFDSDVTDLYTKRGTVRGTSELRQYSGYKKVILYRGYTWGVNAQPIYLGHDSSESSGVDYYISFEGSNKGIHLKSVSSYSWSWSIGYVDGNGNWISNYEASESFSYRYGGELALILADFSQTNGSANSLKWGITLTTRGLIDSFYSSEFLNWDILNDDIVYTNTFFADFEPYVPTPIVPDKGNDGNKGDYDNSSDPITIPQPPTITPINNGLLHGYVVSQSQLVSLGEYLWSDDFIDNFKKVFDNPMDAILGLYQCRYMPTIGENTRIKVGNCDTGVTANLITNNYVSVNCGSVSLSEYFGNALDYSPTTTLQIFLPYVGFQSLNIDVCMAGTITVQYVIDCISGTGVCYVYLNKTLKGTTLQAPLYSYPCSCNSQIPLTAYNMTAIYGATLGAISSVFSGMAKGGTQGFVDGALGVADSIMSAKNHVETNGSISGVSALLGVQKPFLIIERPINAYPEDYNKYYGLPCNMTYQLSKCKGFTKVDKIKVSSINKATDIEKDMIVSILKEGVYI